MLTKEEYRIVREHLKLNVVQMGEKIGCHFTVVHQVESGKWNPKKGKVHDWYYSYYHNMNHDDIYNAFYFLGMTKVPEKIKQRVIQQPEDVVTKITRGRGRPKIDNTDEFNIRFRGPMAQYLYQACKEELYDGPGDFVRDLIRKHKKESKSKLAA